MGQVAGRQHRLGADEFHHLVEPGACSVQLCRVVGTEDPCDDGHAAVEFQQFVVEQRAQEAGFTLHSRAYALVDERFRRVGDFVGMFQKTACRTDRRIVFFPRIVVEQHVGRRPRSDAHLVGVVPVGLPDAFIDGIAEETARIVASENHEAVVHALVDIAQKPCGVVGIAEDHVFVDVVRLLLVQQARTVLAAHDTRQERQCAYYTVFVYFHSHCGCRLKLMLIPKFHIFICG